MCPLDNPLFRQPMKPHDYWDFPRYKLSTSFWVDGGQALWGELERV